MKKLTPVQFETMNFCKKQIDEARKENIDINDINNVKNSFKVKQILNAQNGIVYAPAGVTIRTLKALEKHGLLEVLEDNSGIGTGAGAFPSKVKILNY